MAGHGTTTTTGSRDTKTYNSFTLHTPPPQWQPGDLPHSPAPPSPPASTVHRPPTSHRALRLGLALVSVVLLSALAGGPALAKEQSCADQVIADWYDDGRVGKIYPLECYRQAIKMLPPDVLDYSNAKEEIGRALAFAKQGKPDPGGEDPTPPATTSTGTTKTDTTKTEHDRKTDTTKTRHDRRQSTTDTEHDRHEHDRHLRAVVGTGAAARARRARGAAPRGRLGRLSPPPDGQRRRRRRHAADHDLAPAGKLRRRARPGIFLQIAGK